MASKNLIIIWLTLSSFACGTKPIIYDATIEGKEILTPPPKDVPLILGASVFGVRPGKPVYYHVAASGEKPIIYKAEGLPDGIILDAQTGWITGRAPLEKGDYDIILHVANDRGEASGKFTLRVGETICLTPPMGWNSWYVHSEGVSEEDIREMAKSMEEKGLDQFGWTYINIDDCWMGERDPETKAIQANGKFNDMTAMVDFVNGKGFKMGI